MSNSQPDPLLLDLPEPLLRRLTPVPATRQPAPNRRRTPARRKRRNPGRAGRIAVIWALIGFPLVQLSYFPITDWFPRWRNGEYGDKLANLRSQLAAKSKDQPAVVMFGSSLTGWAFNPSALETIKPGAPGNPVVFNYGINSGGVVVELLILKRVLNDGIRPDLVLIETHPQYLFRAFNTVPGEHYLQVHRFQHQDMEVMRRYDPQVHELRQEWREKQILPWFGNRHELQNHLVPRWIRRVERTDVWTYNDRNGWEYIPSAIEHCKKYTHEQIVTSIQQRVNGLNNSSMEEVFKIAYREIAYTCQKEKIPVVFIRMPETKYALDSYSSALRSQVEEFYATFGTEMNVPILDARTWVDDQHFPDGFHLHPDGAAVFMKRLEREYLGSLLTGALRGNVADARD